MDKILDEIVTRGLAALKKELGVVGYIRFMQFFSPGKGDYTKERHKWLDSISLEELAKRAGVKSPSTPAKTKVKKTRRAS
ncbi:MAG TPA: hypothetical protein VE988_02575 [Gemmataceae bacterium]|nr:hypothetical protein [Gemmataceae bacterium]